MPESGTAEIATESTDTMHESEVESVFNSLKRTKRMKKSDEDMLLQRAIACMEKVTSTPLAMEKAVQDDADDIFDKF